MTAAGEGTAFRELDALAAQFAETDALLGELAPADWDRQTRCAPMRVRELVVHVVNVLPFWVSFLDAEPEGPPTSDRVRWWGYDVATESPKILARAQRAAEGRTPDDLLVAWKDASTGLLDAFTRHPPGRLVGRAHVALPLADLAAVGCVEVGVHTMDLGHATLRGERIHAGALALAVEVLEGIAGEPLPPGLGWDAKTFVLTATGRRPLAPSERRALGPLAARFPLLA